MRHRPSIFLRCLIAVVLAVAAVLLSTVLSASTITMSTKGSIREDAEGNLCRVGLTRYLEAKLGETPVEKNIKSIEAKLLNRCSEFMSDITVAEETKEGDLVVLVGRAEVDDTKVEKVLRDMGLIQGGERTVVVFASEQLLGDWIFSFFNSMAQDEVSFNECEAAVSAALAEQGFDEVEAEFTTEQRREARKLRTVFGRYKDVSAIPNDTATRAAGIVDADARYLVACRVRAESEREKDSAFMYTCCANASCKAVDTKTRRRIATASDSKCVPHANRTTGSVASIRAVCRDMGERLGKKLEKLVAE